MGDPLPPETNDDDRFDALVGAVGTAIYNAVTGAGGENDPSTAWQPQPPTGLTADQLSYLWQGDGVAARICSIFAQWIGQAGIIIESDVEALEDADEAYHLTTEAAQCHVWARLFGAGAQIVVVEGDADWSRPWTPKQGQHVRIIATDGLLVYPVWENTADWGAESGLPDIWRPFADPRNPRYYNVDAGAYLPGVQGYVHWTRILPMRGHPLPPGKASSWVSDLPAWSSVSVLRLCYDALAQYHGTDRMAARIASRLAVWLAQLPAMSGRALDPDKRLHAGLDTWAKSLVSGGVVSSPPGGKVEPAALPLTGFSDLGDNARHSLSAATGISEVLLFGTSPSGLNTDGASWQRSWSVSCASEFDAHYRAPLMRILTGLAVVLTGRAPERLSLSLGDLWRSASDLNTERTQQQRESVTVLYEKGLISREEGRHELAESGMVLDEAEDEAEEVIGEEADDKSDAAQDSYDAPDAARNAARRALEVRETKPPSQRGMTPTGVARARDLANGRRLSLETVRRMKAYFDRHQGDKQGQTWDNQGPGWQAWMGWGGDAGWRWVTRIVEQANRSDADCTGTACLMLDIARVDEWRALQQDVAALLGTPLEGHDVGDPAPTEPHLTALYVGPVSVSGLLALVDGARAAALAAPVPLLRPAGVVAFPSGEDGRRPVVVEVAASPTLAKLHALLLRACAPHVAAEQYLEWRPHVTLGFVPDRADLDTLLSQVNVPSSLGRARTLRLLYGGDTARTFDLTETVGEG